MSRATSLAARPRLPSLGWWLLIGAALALYLTVGWIAAVGLLGLALVHKLRPFDFLTSYLLVVAVGSFVDYSAGTLTFQMWIVTAFLVFMIYCYVLSRGRDSLVLPVVPALKPLLLYLGLTCINFLRGIYLGNQPRYAGLELMAALALGSCLLPANRRSTHAEMRAMLTWMFFITVGHLARGLWKFAEAHGRVGGTFFGPVPGVVAVLLFNFALRASRPSRVALWILAMTPALIHQFISFTRGFWISLIVCFAFSIVAYAGRGVGSGIRWRRSFLALGMLAALGIVGVGLAAARLGVGGIGEMAAERIASSGGTEFHGTTGAESSNIVRLAEYLRVLDDVRKQPVFGYGLGYSFVFREPMTFTLNEQWFTHENYLLVLLKQGLIGLALWVWLLIGLFRTAFRGRDLPHPFERAWCAGAATAVLYCIVYGFVHFPLAEVNTTFTLALIVGVAMNLTRTGTVAIRWNAGAPAGAEPAVP